MKILIIGLGEFGYALLKHISEVNNSNISEIRAFDVREELVQNLMDTHIHPDFPKYPLYNTEIKFYKKLEEAVLDIDIIFLAINSQYIIDIIERIRPYLRESIRIVNTSKALTKDGKFFSELIKKSLSNTNLEYACLAGSTKASDILDGNRVIATLAADNLNYLDNVYNILHSSNFNIKRTSDIIAVELAGVVKNILSILYGYMKNKKYSITEIYYILSKYKIDIEKIYPAIDDESLLPAWQVDLYMGFELGTRNYIVGKLLGDGKTIQEILKIQNNLTLEGLVSLQSLDKNYILSKLPSYLLLQNLLIYNNITDSYFKERILS